MRSELSTASLRPDLPPFPELLNSQQSAISYEILSRCENDFLTLESPADWGLPKLQIRPENQQDFFATELRATEFIKGPPIAHAFKGERQSRRVRKIRKRAPAHEHGPLQGTERVKRQGAIVARSAFALNAQPICGHADPKRDGAVPPLRPADATTITPQLFLAKPSISFQSSWLS